MSQWGGQIRSCINRRARAPRGLREGGQVVLALTIGRDGAVRGVGLAASSGQPALDQAATDAARRAGRCPAAPTGLNDASYSFELPLSLNVR
ncbi:MAG: energy transducer TonB family protein [Paracoccus sp. (in: a-proteobacteria)]|uniref:energy transducer TonB family protein n=1 Tax=Paracoccus sp. TaxID=267 RepID=UPI00405A0B16